LIEGARAASGDARDRLEDLARSRLEEVVKNYPGTRAAKRAQELLNK
jgi:TolA-binding protein